jgi:3-phenylpropionate/trans-cinnamate dioxygenase ferredoxin reductase subunit
MSNRCVIIGAGHGGSQAAVSLRQEGYDGEIVLISDERDLPYHRPPLSKTFLKSSDADGLMLRAQAVYDDNRITLELGVRADAIDVGAKTVTLSDGRVLEWSDLIIATGARARMPDLPGIDLAGVVTLRTIDDARTIRDKMASAQNVAIVGGGFIGMEMAHSCKLMGKDVTLIEAAPRVLARSVAPIVSTHVEQRSRAAGIDVMTGVGLEEITGADGRATGVRLGDGRTVAADLVVLGIGAVANVELAQDAGIELDNGIVVDGAMRTSAPHVYAIGDCVSFEHKQSGRRLRLESVQNATDQARHVAAVIAGKGDDYAQVPWFWSDQGDMKLQTAGLALDTDETIVSGEPQANSFSVYHFAGKVLVAVDSINRPADHMIARRLLAAGISPTTQDIADGAARLKELAGSGRR